MVNHKNKILDCGELKFVPECIEMVKWYQTDSLYFIFATSDRKRDKRKVRDEHLNDYYIDVENAHYVEPSRKFITWKNKCFKESVLGGMVPNDKYRYSENPYKECAQEFWTHQEILDYMKIIPFTPSVMINISPDWRESKLTTEWGKTTVLKKLINDYMKEGWYDYWSYVIENGSEGNHIHAHIVAHMNPQRLKSCESHLRKGNHTQQLKKYSNKVKGTQGTIKGPSVQKVFLRTEELVKDKLLYLQEDHKPEGHKNKSIIENGFVNGKL